MTARFLLDADTCIYVLNRRSPQIVSRFDRLQIGEAAIPAIAFGELAFGAGKSRAPEAAMDRLKALVLIAPLEALPPAAAEHYAEIRLELEAAGKPIGGNDLWIAAHARAMGRTLVTNNEREFRRVPGLKVQNWAA